MSKPEQAVTHACQDVRWTKCACLINDHSFTACEPCLAKGAHSEACVCKGSGLRFPGLSRECFSGRQWCIANPDHAQSCEGRGRVSVQGLDAWLDAAVSIAHYSNFISSNEEGGELLHSFMINNKFYGQGPTRVEAIQEAVCKAVGGHIP